MAQSVNVKNVGLRGVTVADTKISFIDGEKRDSPLPGIQDRTISPRFFFHGGCVSHFEWAFAQQE